MSGWSKSDAVLDAIYGALERWDREERSAANARIARSLHRGEGPQRVTRTADGSRIPAPRRSALARYLTNEALNAIREAERPAEPDGEPSEVSPSDEGGEP